MANEELSNKVETNANDESLEPMQRLERAMCHCGFGRFHVRLLSAALAACFANNVLTANTSFLLPSAECDLNMDIVEKGLLNSAPFLGMIASGVFSGFLTDTFGRKRFLVGGYFGVFLSCLIEGSSQNYATLVTGKFLEGICLTIGFNPNMTMVAELTNKDIRDRVMVFFSAFKCVALVVIVAITWLMLTQDWHFVLIQNVFELRTWSIYLYSCGLWSLLASLQYCYLPESPKFLLAQGRSDEALHILAQIYSENTGKSPETFPVKTLGFVSTDSEVNSRTIPIGTRMASALHELKSLFKGSPFRKLLIFCIMALLNMLAYNTFRLWYPQISTIIETYEAGHPHNRSDALCAVINNYLDDTVASGAAVTDLVGGTDQNICISHPSGSQTYINGIVMGLVCFACHVVSGVFVGRLSQKTLIFWYLVASSAFSVGLYWCTTNVQVMALMSSVVGLTQATASLLFTMIVRVFPTTVRTMSVAMVTMVGRVGSTAGNLLFPYMLQNNCMTPFFSVTVITFCVAFVVFLLPNPSKDNKVTGDN